VKYFNLRYQGPWTGASEGVGWEASSSTCLKALELSGYINVVLDTKALGLGPPKVQVGEPLQANLGKPWN
jgi:hypothetical protein